MKLLHLTKKYDNLIGGDAVVVRNLREQQISRGDKVSIVTSNNPKIVDQSYIYKFGLEMGDNELDTINLKRLKSLVILFFSSFKLLKSIKPDIVHCHSIDMGFVFSFACRLYRIPILATFHCGFFSIKNTFSLRSFAENVFIKISGFKKIVTVNSKDILSLHNKDISYIPNGVDISIFKPNFKKSNTVKTIIFVGRLVKVKGLDYLLSAFSSVSKQHSKTKLQIIGDGNYKSAVINIAKKLSINNVEFINNVSQKQIAKYLAQADVLVLPSTEGEGFGLVLIEALASGTPVISTDITGLSRQIKKTNCGYVIPKEDATKLAECMVEIIKNPILAEKMGRNGLELINKEFSWRKVSDKYNKIYLKILYEKNN